MSKDIKKEIRKTLDKKHFMVIKSYNEDDLEYHRVIRYQDRLLAKRRKEDPVPIDDVLERSYIEMLVTDTEEDLQELLDEEVRFDE